MEIQNDTYKTLSQASPEALFKDRNSKFYGYAFPVSSEDEIKKHLEELRKMHHSARHWCYAYQLGAQEKQRVFRANDDGEPNNSAGMPIYGQIQSFDLTNVLVIVVRYFGGVKLGVGGLINAYRTAAQMTLDDGIIIEKTINVNYRIKFDYKNMNKVMRIIKEKQLTVVSQTLELDCELIISVRLTIANQIFEIFDALYEVQIKEFND
ncbi:YigZ family protein [Psychroserpens sp.]|uniref:IMPACT family protein n=1 Tax=Psychroserpens sp. TaxID=2020870 RepID=UPI001B0A748E|nr:YigZ family protein [Psychroserpens sp.]MBO6606818.1 YigZ family protein [Psychroserpens sp.]MBO6631137.1 YigZ family protein [Psychroserpens sp.]MBO6653521.1 YigZ family protein [Psychroserpens sp.]MBO6680451.1 YigZ family protein [Psychroserpens sp.]MBO6750590.1 YigZ family protein [Psychroserpens sp.]